MLSMASGPLMARMRSPGRTGEQSACRVRSETRACHLSRVFGPYRKSASARKWCIWSLPIPAAESVPDRNTPRVLALPRRSCMLDVQLTFYSPTAYSLLSRAALETHYRISRKGLAACAISSKNTHSTLTGASCIVGRRLSPLRPRYLTCWIT